MARLERFPPSLFLRQTDLTEATPAVVAFAESVKLTEDDPLGQLHALMVALHDKVEEQGRAGIGRPP